MCPALCSDSAGVQHSSLILALNRVCGQQETFSTYRQIQFPKPQKSSLGLHLGRSWTSDRCGTLYPTLSAHLPRHPSIPHPHPRTSGSIPDCNCPHLLTLTKYQQWRLLPAFLTSESCLEWVLPNTSLTRTKSWAKELWEFRIYCWRYSCCLE